MIETPYQRSTRQRTQLAEQLAASVARSIERARATAPTLPREAIRSRTAGVSRHG